jgi:predicted ATPase
MTRESSTWGLVHDARAPLLGREAEVKALDDALEAVEAKKETRIVTVIGPAGIGKSRLVQDFVVKHRAGD